MSSIVRLISDFAELIEELANELFFANSKILGAVSVGKSVVDYVLQFIPPAFRWLFCVEIVWGIGYFILKSAGRFRNAVKWW